MFDRGSKRYSDTVDIASNLSRYEDDSYLTKYLVGVINPEFDFQISSSRNKLTPQLSATGGGLDWGFVSSNNGGEPK